MFYRKSLSFANARRQAQTLVTVKMIMHSMRLISRAVQFIAWQANHRGHVAFPTLKTACSKESLTELKHRSKLPSHNWIFFKRQFLTFLVWFTRTAKAPKKTNILFQNPIPYSTLSFIVFTVLLKSLPSWWFRAMAQIFSSLQASCEHILQF